MSDPAIEAARRAWTNIEHDDVAEGAAREMAKPIRELYEDWSRIDAQGCSISHREIFDRLGPLIYSSEELS